MKTNEIKNSKAKLFGRLAALSLAVWTLGGCDPEPKEDAPDKSPQEIAHEKAVAEKAAFDTWIEAPERIIRIENVGDLPLLNEDVINIRDNLYNLNYFKTPHTAQDAKDELAARPAPIVKAPAPKNSKQGANVQYIASVNKLNQQIVRNSLFRMGLAVVVSPL